MKATPSDLSPQLPKFPVTTGSAPDSCTGNTQGVHSPTDERIENYALASGLTAQRTARIQLSSALKRGCLGQSPIEEAFSLELFALCKLTGVALSYTDPEGMEHPPTWADTAPYEDALAVVSQMQLGRYRADFVLVAGKVMYRENAEGGSLVVVPQGQLFVIECDGTAFHERTEPERRREKARDRWMQRHGYKVLRFTGAELLSRGPEVAEEVMRDVMGTPWSSWFTSREDALEELRQDATGDYPEDDA